MNASPAHVQISELHLQLINYAHDMFSLNLRVKIYSLEKV